MQEEQNVQTVEEEVTQEEAPVNDTEQAEIEETDAATVKKSNRKSAQHRIHQLTAKNYTLQSEIDDIKRQLEKKAPVDMQKSPSRESFDDEDQYLDAKIEWKAQQLLQKQNQEIKQKETYAKQQQQMTKMQESVRDMNFKGIDEFDDYEDIAYSAPITDNVAYLLSDMDNGHKVAYYLGSHPDIAVELNNKTPYRQAIELKKIEEKLTTKKITNALPPASGQKGSSIGVVNKDPANMTPEEYRKWRMPQIYK